MTKWVHTITKRLFLSDTTINRRTLLPVDHCGASHVLPQQKGKLTPNIRIITQGKEKSFLISVGFPPPARHFNYYRSCRILQFAINLIEREKFSCVCVGQRVNLGQYLGADALSNIYYYEAEEIEVRSTCCCSVSVIGRDVDTRLFFSSFCTWKITNLL